MSSNEEKTDKYKKNLDMYNDTISKLVNGELDVLSDNERSAIRTHEMMEKTKSAFQQTINQTDTAISRTLGAERVWITRGLNLVIYLCAIEDYADFAKYTNSEGFIELPREELFKVDQKLVEAYLSIQSLLRLFLTERDSPGKVVALKAVASSGHPVVFYGEGYVGRDGVSSDFYAKVNTKRGFIRAKENS